MIESSVTTTEERANDLILCDSDRGLGKYVDPLSCRQRKGQMISYSVTATEDWGNVWILSPVDRGLGK